MLLLIDIQNDYFPGGRMELVESVEASLRAAELLSFFRREGLPVVLVQHVSLRPGATFFLPDTDGVKIHENVRPLENEPVFEKHYPNAFRDTPLLAHLRGAGISRLVICGMMTHMCVDATVRAAFDLGFECLVAGDACATKALAHGGRTVAAPDVHAAFLAALNGTYAKVSGTADIIARLSP
ncbi:MAG: cysteine hydrolase family protein [Candidatus Krumholzibacteriaceae bacterium]|jgi:nicotinamidase-related amidase